jgi:hypothetical protein
MINDSVNQSMELKCESSNIPKHQTKNINKGGMGLGFRV